MKFDEFYKEPIKCFKGVCDRVRKLPGGEEFWQKMMKHKEEISEDEFLEAVNPEDVLDPGETWEEYQSGHTDIKFFKSIDDTYFFQTAGFEFIWKEDK